MENQELITIIHAAQISGKSIQTIRRMIKQRKIRVRKQKTPQGFNYLIIKESLHEFMEDSRPLLGSINTQNTASSTQENRTASVEPEMVSPEPQMTVKTEPIFDDKKDELAREHRSLNDEAVEEFRREVGKFNSTIQTLIEQNAKDKSNFFELIKTFQDRVIILENQIKQLEAPKPSRWKFWK